MLDNLPRNVIYRLLGNSDAAAECERTDEAVSVAARAVGLLESYRRAPALTREQVTALNIIDSQYPELCILDIFDCPPPPNESLSRHTASKVVRQLVEYGLAERTAGPRKGVALTDKGRAVVSDLRAQFRR